MARCLCSQDLNRKVTVKTLKSDATINSDGKVDETIDTNWMKLGEEWCQFISAGSREFLVGTQLNQNATHQVTMRYSTRAKNYTTKDRLEYDGRLFAISGPPQNVDEKDKWLRFAVNEFTA